MIYGTAYFPTMEDVFMYYMAQGHVPEHIFQKVRDGEVHVGLPPDLHSLRRAKLHDDQGGSKRYFIYEDVRVG